MTTLRPFFIGVLLLLPLTAFPKVASFNQIATDLLREVGGGKVSVVEVVGHGADPHTFQPKASDLKKLEDCSALFFMGKGLELYLPGLKDAYGSSKRIVEIGRALPSQKVDSDPIYTCCPAHSRNSIDPHWWHNVRNMERAAKIVCRELQKIDPANKEHYKVCGEAARQKYANLHNWVKSQVRLVDKSDRLLVTAHAAFAYFCKEYGFEAAYVQGLSRDGKISAQHLTDTVKTIRDRKIKAVFPEQLANPKLLNQIAYEAGTKIGKPLFADTIPGGYEKMIYYNVDAIVRALK